MKKIVIFLIVALGGVVLAGFSLLYSRRASDIDCSNIRSISVANACIGQEVVAIGKLECDLSDRTGKITVSILGFGSNEGIRIFEKIPDCQNYNGKAVKVRATLLELGSEVQAGSGIYLDKIKSIIPD